MLRITAQGMQTLIKWLWGIFLLLFLMNFITNMIGFITGHFSVYGILDLFEFHKERNFPTYFSSITLLFAALLLYSIYSFHKHNAQSDSKYWLALSIIFLLLSIDDFVSVHERLNDFLTASFTLGGIFHWIWVIPAMIICLILAGFFLKFYLRLPHRYKWLFGLSALLLVGGAVGVEMFDGYVNSTGTSPPWLLFTSFTVKESMEMVGVLLFLYSLTDYIKVNMPDVPSGPP
jgi:hypothetical protein